MAGDELMSGSVAKRPADWEARAKAVDIKASCIVQAPAGSGKTELLVQRILALLAVAEKPEEILSITFTRKAAGEMRLRVLQALESASADASPDEAHARETWQKAKKVLARDKEKGWHLLQNPSRLQLMTIDSFCAYLTRRMPWMARFGDQPGVTDDPADLYRKAAESLLTQLEQGGAGQSAIEALLTHLDNRLPLLRDLLVAMLSRRDQWLRHLLAQRKQAPRQVLEDGLALYVTSYLQHALETLGVETYRELRELGGYAANCLGTGVDQNPFAVLINEPEDPCSRQQWLAIADLALTSAGTIRKSVNKNTGFPADKTPLAQEMKIRALALLDELKDQQELVDALQGLRKLPATSYGAEQWRVLEALIELLPLAVVELQEVFSNKGVVDFIEISGAAKVALGSENAPEELLLQLDSRLQHILVDEFQDTSYAQYDLLRCLTAGWTPGDGRTLFVVGDPMQSIYRFREAEVGLYLRVCQRGLDNLTLDRIVLNTNFRSTRAIVGWTNSTFKDLFPEAENELQGAVTFSPAIAFDQQPANSNITFHGFLGKQEELEAVEVVNLIKQAKNKQSDGTIAVLVRSRAHLSEIVLALKDADIRYQAQDIDPLANRPVVQDIVALARALHRPADRVAWLSVLRAPWCGLSLQDLVSLCSHEPRTTIWQLLTRDEPQSEMFDHISVDGRSRLDRIQSVLERSLNNLGRLSTRRLVESTWLALNGPACVDEAGMKDAEQTFLLLDQVDREKGLDDLEVQLGKLFAAPDPLAGPEVQLMTIHKAKGLEFDTVILPGLGRGIRGQDRELLRWLEHPDYELLLAPIPPLLSEQQDPTYSSIGQILKEKDELETVRLLYVAATRARTHLHLLGHLREDRDGQLKPMGGSLLSVLWPACEESFLINVAKAPQTEQKNTAKQKIRRLPTLWKAPPLPGRLSVASSQTKSASMTGHYDEEPLRSRRTEEGRVVGTLIHDYLERIANEGLNNWARDKVDGEESTFRAKLSMLGVPSSRLDSCSRTVSTCLVNTLKSERGRWLLGSHSNAVSELPVNGLIDGQLVRATIDRTFIDEEDSCWVIDYKTSSPDQGENSQDFMQKELGRYQEQLTLYISLLERLREQKEIRAALYFPFFDGWIELQ